ncbi:Mo-nitrogenase MoFe protein subunit NifD precursor [Anaerobacterium chartisolvens]|uniref:nitrogenase n=1 Tax=Anaerobacterium chartisolvens TaxID=1297424 RepID=A0A369AWX0_9FIRM|nr:nitrogenase component I subunit alpha [Anaerobacterium chartisolvens]RCX12726.1 Mo-nitrogenase MoFe protein subunit NifD precursor [Anaerobacterium chartisolvens]
MNAVDIKQKVSKTLEQYPAAVFKNRKDHVIVKDSEADVQIITANTRTVPGIITNRGCCYAGCKGVVLGPLRDALIITHGPIGCGYYSWGTRRHKGRIDGDEKNYLSYCLSTDLQEGDIVFGGDKKLKQAITEAVEIFHPETIMICSTCPVGLIGDDINADAAWAQKEFGIKVLAFSCEGYKGVSQSGGHHIANNSLIKHVIGTGERAVGKYSLNILGEYNIGGDGWEVERIMKRIGYDIVSVMTGNGTVRDLSNAHLAHLNVVQCHRSINYIGEMMNTKYGHDWIKVNFIGVQSMAKSLRDIAAYFGDKDLIDRTEEVIAEEISEISDAMEYFRNICQGKTAALFVGGSRAHHYQMLLKDIGVETVLAGYEFGHRDDYEGREVIPTIKADGDSKNIESIEVEPDSKYYRVFLSPERVIELKNTINLNDYPGMMKGMSDGSIVIDDLNHYETEEFLKILKPDIFCSGIKDKYISHKAGVFSKQLHSYDYSGPYAGFKGAVNFARDIAMGLTTPSWKLITPPWKKEPMLEGTMAV